MGLIEHALEQGIAPALVIAVYLIVVKIIDSRKENIQTKMNDDLVQSINKISSFIMELTKNIIEKDKDKCKNAIEDAFYSSGMRLMNFVSQTVTGNHIDTNKEIVTANIHNISNAEYYSVVSSLGAYTINGVKVSDYMKPEWIKEIEKSMLDCVYNKKLDDIHKMMSFSKKINIQLQNYVNYVSNNMAK